MISSDHEFGADTQQKNDFSWASPADMRISGYDQQVSHPHGLMINSDPVAQLNAPRSNLTPISTSQYSSPNTAPIPTHPEISVKQPLCYRQR